MEEKLKNLKKKKKFDPEKVYKEQQPNKNLMSEQQKNVLGEDLEECSNNPLTGWFEMVVAIQTKMIMAAYSLCKS